MSHRWRMRRILTALQHGELSNKQRLQVDRHLARCQSCRDRLRSWREADRLLHDTQPGPTSLPAEAAQAIFARALHEAGVRMDGRPHSGRRRALIRGFGSAFLAILALLAVRPHPPEKIAGIDPNSRLRPLDTAPKRLLPLDANADSESSMADDYATMRRVVSTPVYGHAPANHPRRRRRHPRRRWTYAAAHLPRRHHALRTAAEPQEAWAASEPQEPQGRLVVTVTHEPGLAVEVSHADEDAPGYAEATCFRRDPYGGSTWQRCMIRKDEAGAETVQTQIAMAAPQPELDLLIVQAATGAAEHDKEQRK